MSRTSLSWKMPTEYGGRCTACASTSACRYSHDFCCGRKASTISSWLRFMIEKKVDVFSAEKPRSRAKARLLA